MQDDQSVSPLSIRLPIDLKQWLKHRAVDNHRSANTEIVSILEHARQKENAAAVAAATAS